MRAAILLYFLMTSISIQAQIISTNSTAVDENRYKDIKGSPYILDDFAEAVVYDADGETINDVLANYNAFEHGVEVKKDNRITILDEDFYPKVIISKKGKKKEKASEIVLVHSPESNKKGTYVQEIFASEDIKFYKQFRVSQSENKTEAPGKTFTTKRFALKTEYLLDYNGELKQVKGKLDAITEVIGNTKELKTYCKKNKNKLKSDQDWNDLFSYHSTL
jgi:hypothetical protein